MHSDRRFVRRGKVSAKKYDLQREKLYGVIDTLGEILNRYSRSYNGSNFRLESLGEDDVQTVMDYIRFHIEERKKQLEAFKKQTGNKG